MPVEEKIPYMIEWWHKAQGLILASNLNRSMVRELVHQSRLELRTGVREFISELLRSQTPILIFSAGLGKNTTAQHARFIVGMHYRRCDRNLSRERNSSVQTQPSIISHRVQFH
jgi:hypothetical protein